MLIRNGSAPALQQLHKDGEGWLARGDLPGTLINMPPRNSEVVQNLHRAQRSGGMKRQESQPQVLKMISPQILRLDLTQKEGENASMK